MSVFINASQSGRHAQGSEDYVWQYEYYDDQEPVSFEGLKAHRYSIVIGFWVSLAVFVLFMFFVLMLLTKTGPPHPENPLSYQRQSCLGDGVPDVGRPQVLSCPLSVQSRSVFHFYINEEEQSRARAGVVIGQERPDGRDLEPERLSKSQRGNGEEDFLSDFNIPNFVNAEHSSTTADNDVTLYESPIITESQ